MLQQTQVKTVVPYWERWMRALPTLQKLADADQQTIHKLWEGLGYYSRVRNLQKAAHEIISRHAGQFPRTHEALLALPGIGTYTAGAICSIAFNQPEPILDGNVMRVLTRVFAIPGNPREKAVNRRLWGLARELVTTAEDFKLQISNFKFEHPVILKSSANPQSAIRTPQFCSQLNQSLMELGALICTPKQPQCPRCPLRGDCRAFRSRSVGDFPNLGERAVATRRHFVAFVIQRGNRYLVRQRPAGQVNAQLWEFPNFEITDAQRDPLELAREHFGVALTDLAPLRTIRHTITRYRITLAVRRAIIVRASPSKSSLPGRWLTLEQIEALPFTSAHRKIIAQISTHPAQKFRGTR